MTRSEAACAGAIIRPSKPIASVGKPRAMTPLMKPASKNVPVAARSMTTKSRSTMRSPNLVLDRCRVVLFAASRLGAVPSAEFRLCCDPGPSPQRGQPRPSKPESP